MTSSNYVSHFFEPSIDASRYAAVMMIGMCKRKAAHFPSHHTILMQK